MQKAYKSVVCNSCLITNAAALSCCRTRPPPSFCLSANSEELIIILHNIKVIMCLWMYQMSDLVVPVVPEQPER